MGRPRLCSDLDVPGVAVPDRKASTFEMLEDPAVERLLETQGKVACILACRTGVERADRTDPQGYVAIGDGGAIGLEVTAQVRKLGNADFGRIVAAYAFTIENRCHTCTRPGSAGPFHSAYRPGSCRLTDEGVATHPLLYALSRSERFQANVH